MAVTTTTTGASVVATDLPAGRYVDWGPIVIGTLGALAIMVVLMTFGGALGLSVTSAQPYAGLSAKALAVLAGLYADLVHVASFSAGGYLAGRLRAPWVTSDTVESHFRDGGHGFAVWALGVVLGAVFALFQRIPGSLVPAEDQGYVFMVTVLPPAAAISRTREVTKEATAALMKNPAVANVVTFSGFDLLSRALKSNSGISFVTLKDWSQRTDPKEDARNLAPALAAINANFKDGVVVFVKPEGGLMFEASIGGQKFSFVPVSASE
jgi:hypothetical protein